MSRQLFALKKISNLLLGLIGSPCLVLSTRVFHMLSGQGLTTLLPNRLRSDILKDSSFVSLGAAKKANAELVEQLRRMFGTE